MSDERREGLWRGIKAMAVLSGVGIYLTVFVGICLFLGIKADELLGSHPAGKVIALIAGFPGAFYTLYRQLKQSGVV